MPARRMSRRISGGVLIALVLTSSTCGASEPDPPPGSRTVAIAAPSGESLQAIEVGSSARVAILSHGATGTKEDFFGIAAAFADAGWRAIAYDAGSDREGDLRAVVTYASETGADAIVLLGGSLGASLSIGMVSELGADAVVSLSAPASSFGALQAAGELDVPLFVAVAEDNEPFTTDARAIAEAAGVDPVIVSGSGHGTGMFRDHPELMAQVVDFAEDATAA